MTLKTEWTLATAKLREAIPDRLKPEFDRAVKEIEPQFMAADNVDLRNNLFFDLVDVTFLEKTTDDEEAAIIARLDEMPTWKDDER